MYLVEAIIFDGLTALSSRLRPSPHHPKTIFLTHWIDIEKLASVPEEWNAATVGVNYFPSDSTSIPSLFHSILQSSPCTFVHS